MRAMSLVSSEGENEQNEIRNLQEKLESTMSLVKQLSGQLSELKEQVRADVHLMGGHHHLCVSLGTQFLLKLPSSEYNKPCHK